ncbi:hypothetical protein [Chromobacterium sp. CV08]
MKILLLTAVPVVVALWFYIRKFWLDSEDAIHLSHHLPDRDHV